MAEPALKIETDFVRIAVEALAMRWSPSVELDLSLRGLDLTDLHNALTCCLVQRSNKSEATGAFFDVVGETTESISLRMRVYVDLDLQYYRVEEVS
jgi:hypothetical protein